MKIKELPISARAKVCLLNAGYEDVDDLKEISNVQLLCIRNLGKKGATEVRTFIEGYFDEEDEADEVIGSSVDTKIEELGFSAKTYNWLKRAGINTIKDLCDKASNDTMPVRNLGRKSLEEILLN